jgi:hypothetical protein
MAAVAGARPAAVAQRLVTIAEMAVMLNRSQGTVRREDRLGLIPAPVRRLKKAMWRLDEVEHWLVAGCPPRSKWTWKGGGRRGR